MGGDDVRQGNALVSALMLAVIAGACAKDDAIVETKGSCADAFKASMCTYAKTKGSTLVEAGAVIPMASIENAPKTAPMVWPPVADAVANMPDSSVKQSGMTHMTFYWEADGHPPVAFMTPHFDFHFYLTSPAEVASMDCKDLSKPSALPAAFTLRDEELPPDMQKMMGVKSLVGLCVPGMGMHSLLTSEYERKDAFEGSMVIGYYKGKAVFIEPMISKATLMKKASFDIPIPDVPGLTGAHPTKFHAEWDAAGNSYRFMFTGFAAGT
jgi:hypothetical protein